MRRKAVSEGVTTSRLGETGRLYRRFHGLLHRVFVEMMPAPYEGARIDSELLRREDPLPAPCLGRIGVLHTQGIGQPDSGNLRLAVLGKQVLQPNEVCLQRVLE